MTESDLIQKAWYQELRHEVEAAFRRSSSQHEAVIPALESERTTLQQNVKGWSQTLANPELQPAVRIHVESQFNAALERIAEIERAINLRESELQKEKNLIEPSAIVDRLNDLAAVLAGNNPSWGSVELAHHIDRIDCYDDHVVVRICRLGSLDTTVDIFSELEPLAAGTSTPSAEKQSGRTKRRRLTRRKIVSGEAPKVEDRARATWASDPNRFAGLDDRWFVEHRFPLPERQSWAARHAAEVGELRKQSFTEEMLAEHFEKSLPTIRESLRIAKTEDPELARLPRRMPRAKWHEVNAQEVAAKKAATGMSNLALAKYFGRSDTTIRSALNFAEALNTKKAKPTPSRS